MLLLDVGNSRLKWALADQNRIQSARSEAHDGDPATLLRKLALPQAAQVWVAQVVGPAHEHQLSDALRQHYGFAPRFARTQAECRGLRVAYAEPARLGVDRWLAMLALWTQTRRPFCVVNAGTALTFDAVDETGGHQGGLIAPGLLTAEKSVLDATRFPVRAQAADYTPGLGCDTESCVRQGALHACAGLIERAARQASGARFIGGGDAGTLLPHLEQDWHLRPNLVLEGLLALARGE